VSRDALIEDLRRKAAEDAAAIWRDAKDAAGKLQFELAQAAEERRTAATRAASDSARRLDEAAAADAGREARRIRAAAATVLADRLHAIARAELPGLGREGGEQMFAALVAELPLGDWRLVRVNPADRPLARERFPQAEIVGDERISAGLEVETDGGRIRVRNTLETRLEAAWPDMLPGLISSIQSECVDHRTPA
jgi:V/A-type H+-transporting ATPase subunit E